jgi:hypothetical protein
MRRHGGDPVGSQGFPAGLPPFRERAGLVSLAGLLAFHFPP